MFLWLTRWFRRHPSVELTHPRLGRLVGQRGLWGGTVERAGLDIDFYIAGTVGAPDPVLMDSLESLLNRFESRQDQALSFLRTQEALLAHAELTFYALDFLWPDKPDDFALEFCEGNAMFGVWRVEFVNGRPERAGFDD